MGIRNIKTLINKYSPTSIRKISLKDLSNKKIAIDVSIYLYKYKYGKGNDEVKYFLTSFLKQINHLNNFNITPIYIFDGKPPKEKNECIDDRRNTKKQKYERMENLEEKIESITTQIPTIEKEKKHIYINNVKEMKKEMNKIKMSIIHIKQTDIILLKEMFDLLGIEYYQADTEAEIICSRLVRNNYVYGALSDDTDLLPNGTNKFYSGYDFNKDFLIEIHLPSILENFKINMNQFIDICILCGCDYSNKIKAIGPINAYKLIVKYKDIENIIENIKDNKKYEITDEFISNFKYKQAREIFLKDYKIEINKKTELDKKNIIQFIKKYNIKFDIRTLYC